MAHIFHDDFVRRKDSISGILLCLFWTAGLVSGVLLFSGYSHLFLPLMRGIFQKSVSIVCLYWVLFLPFLLSAFAVFIDRQLLIYPICFLKALTFILISGSVQAAFGSAGWLAWRLLMFCDIFSIPFLFLYWIRYISGIRRFSIVEFFSVTSILFLLGSIDYCCISPLLAML